MIDRKMRCGRFRHPEEARRVNNDLRLLRSSPTVECVHQSVHAAAPDSVQRAQSIRCESTADLRAVARTRNTANISSRAGTIYKLNTIVERIRLYNLLPDYPHPWGNSLMFVLANSGDSRTWVVLTIPLSPKGESLRRMSDLPSYSGTVPSRYCSSLWRVASMSDVPFMHA